MSHIFQCSPQKVIELFPFRLRKTGHDLFLIFSDLLADRLMAGRSFRQQDDSLAAPIRRIRQQTNELFFLQSAEQARNRRMAQSERILNILGAGRLFLSAHIADDLPLGRCQLHLRQCVGHAGVYAPVKDADLMSDMAFRNITPIKRSKLRNILAQLTIDCNPFYKIFTIIFPLLPVAFPCIITETKGACL